jgi:hypothetical protein
MYGCFEARLVYGWQQMDKENVIDEDWLTENNVESFTRRVTRNNAGEFIYGLPCKVGNATGIIRISNRNKRRVKKAHQASGSTSKLGYTFGIKGDYHMTQHYSYVPGESSERASSSERSD